VSCAFIPAAGRYMQRDSSCLTLGFRGNLIFCDPYEEPVPSNVGMTVSEYRLGRNPFSALIEAFDSPATSEELSIVIRRYNLHENATWLLVLQYCSTCQVYTQ